MNRALVTAVASVTLLAVASLAQATPVRGTPNRTATFDGTVRAIAYSGTTVFVGGDFTTATYGGRTYPRSRLAALDGRTGQPLPWAPSADKPVRALAVTGDSVYAVGDFTRVSGVARDSLARLDPVTGAVRTGFAHTIMGTTYAASIGAGRLYVGGSFTGVDGVPMGGVAAFDLGSGALDRGFQAYTDGRVETLVATATRLYLGGDFHRTNDVDGSARLAAVQPATGAYDAGFRPRAPYVVHGLTLGPDTLYAVIGGPGGRLTAYSPNGSAKWTTTTDGDAQAVALLGDTLYLGGHFDNVCRSARTGTQGKCIDGSDRRVKIAAVGLDGRLLPWAPQANGVEGVYAVAAGPGLLACGGVFTTVAGLSQARFAQFPG